MSISNIFLKRHYPPMANTDTNNHSDNSFGPSDADDIDGEDELLNDDFMNDKHEADKNYLSQLKQITQNSELKVESNTDFSMLKNRRQIMSSRENSFLYSPSPSARGHSSASKMSNYSGTKQRSVIASSFF